MLGWTCVAARHGHICAWVAQWHLAGPGQVAERAANRARHSGCHDRLYRACCIPCVECEADDSSFLTGGFNGCWPCLPSPCRAHTTLKKPCFVKSHIIHLKKEPSWHSVELKALCSSAGGRFRRLPRKRKAERDLAKDTPSVTS